MKYILKIAIVVSSGFTACSPGASIPSDYAPYGKITYIDSSRNLVYFENRNDVDAHSKFYVPVRGVLERLNITEISTSIVCTLPRESLRHVSVGSRVYLRNRLHYISENELSRFRLYTADDPFRSAVVKAVLREWWPPVYPARDESRAGGSLTLVSNPDQKISILVGITREGDLHDYAIVSAHRNVMLDSSYLDAVLSVKRFPIPPKNISGDIVWVLIDFDYRGSSGRGR